ncbi:signal peptide peptidase SppA [Azospirillum fermentarium]|uniref:S49 family peptidase n=1 Tax=Azospirillum fermentarium TaxID=1233114 RepID=UPI002226F518|nr:S49 family peptidase [Azospirillum fermentarium]MCW2248286.1 signal peptide peptidase SppA [Azospirillum fermentarium]
MKDLIAMIGDPWAITDDGFAAVAATVEALSGADLPDGPAALSAENDRPLPGTRTAEFRDGTAIIPVRGPLFARGNWLTRYLGFGDYQTIAQDFRTAHRDPGVKAVILDVDSPGGMVTGVAELAALIHQARGKGKPIIAFAGGMMASAAYWLGSAADTVVAAETALVGSIGVRVDVQDTSERDARSGVKRLTVVSRQTPNKGADMGSDEGRNQVQGTVDALATVFIETVARHRGTTADAVADGYGKGGVMVARDAKTAGMIDRIGTFESVAGDLSAANTPAGWSGITAGHGGTTTPHEEPMTTIEVSAITADYIAANHPDIAKKFRDDGAAQGAKAESERIRKIDALALPGCDGIAATAKADPSMTVEAFAVAQAEHLKAKKATALDRFTTDDQGFTPPAADAGKPDAGAAGGDDATVKALIASIANA